MLIVTKKDGWSSRGVSMERRVSTGEIHACDLSTLKQERSV